jgi:hypothetical protein
MTSQELEQLRREKWRTSGNAVVTLEDAHAFLDQVGICLLYAEKPPILLPTLVGAVAGEDRDLPTAKLAFADERARRAADLAQQLVRRRAAFESSILPGNTLLLSAEVFPYFYALVGEGRTGQVKRPDLSQLARLAWQILERKGKATPEELRAELGAELSTAALERALQELWARLRVVPEERAPQERWATMERWAPEVARRALGISVGVALSALVSQYIQAVVAAEQKEVEDFFGRFLSRSRVRDAVQALLAAREFSFVHVGKATLLEITPPRVPFQQRVAVIPERIAASAEPGVEPPTAEPPRQIAPPAIVRRTIGPSDIERRRIGAARIGPPKFVPRTDRPQSDRPKFERPKFDRPKSDRPRSDRPKFDRPKFDRPKSDRPKFDRPKSDRPKSDRPKFDRPKSDRPKFDRPKSDRPQSDRPRSDRPKSDRPKSDSSKFGGPRFGRPKSGAKKRPFKPARRRP